MGSYVEMRNNLADVIRVSFVTLSLILVTLFLLNIDTLHNPIDLLKNFFIGYERTRNAIGFMHPNASGNTALAAIMISAFYNCKNTKMRTRVLVYLADVIFMYVILESASRTSLIAVMIFVLIRAYIFILMKIKGTFPRIMLTIILGLTSLLLLDLSMDIFLLTNRAGNFYYNIPILKSNNALWTGLAYIGSGEFMSTSYGTFFVDNYLLYTLMSTGILGLIFNIIFMISLSIKVFKIANNSSSMYKTVALILIVNIIMSMTETCFMYPSFSSSYIFTVLYLSVFAKKTTKRRKNVNYCE
ncbi:MAG: hypothetical protein RR443_09635 [Anaerorhabdus sp.]|uniref:hypothetical protein n=1 Tax=Anaerorhabdus sp. TaxID=1872524 RepID=UPI002FCAEE12